MGGAGRWAAGSNSNQASRRGMWESWEAVVFLQWNHMASLLAVSRKEGTNLMIGLQGRVSRMRMLRVKE